MTQAHLPDPCCGRALSKALLSGALDAAESWECGKCGQEWRPREVAGVRMWEQYCYFEVLRKR